MWRACATLVLILGPWRAAPAEALETGLYPVKSDIVTTCFWVGEPAASGGNSNLASAWDPLWVQHFGGVDAPGGFTRISSSSEFTARHLNAYYVALPFNDLKFPEIARKVVPWWNESSYRNSPGKSQCQGRWIKICYRSSVCYAQWEDVGPFSFDNHQYVFGADRPGAPGEVGLDVSPAVQRFLGLSGKDRTDWQFVDAGAVPRGPWWGGATGKIRKMRVFYLNPTGSPALAPFESN